LDDLDGVILHPGGPKVLEAIEGALELPHHALKHAWDILAEYGNMSSPTALFVLERTLSAGATGRHLLIAFGPGFTASFCLLDL
jgi:alkylresorcinol/alkylpyrone synthase